MRPIPYGKVHALAEADMSSFIEIRSASERLKSGGKVSTLRRHVNAWGMLHIAVLKLDIQIRFLELLSPLSLVVLPPLAKTGWSTFEIAVPNSRSKPPVVKRGFEHRKIVQAHLHSHGHHQPGLRSYVIGSEVNRVKDCASCFGVFGARTSVAVRGVKPFAESKCSS